MRLSLQIMNNKIRMAKVFKIYNKVLIDEGPPMELLKRSTELIEAYSCSLMY